jgi:hypothetical protein
MVFASDWLQEFEEYDAMGRVVRADAAALPASSQGAIDVEASSIAESDEEEDEFDFSGSDRSTSWGKLAAATGSARSGARHRTSTAPGARLDEGEDLEPRDYVSGVPLGVLQLERALSQDPGAKHGRRPGPGRLGPVEDLDTGAMLLGGADGEAEMAEWGLEELRGATGGGPPQQVSSLCLGDWA